MIKNISVVLFGTLFSLNLYSSKLLLIPPKNINGYFKTKSKMQEKYIKKRKKIKN